MRNLLIIVLGLSLILMLNGCSTTSKETSSTTDTSSDTAVESAAAKQPKAPETLSDAADCGIPSIKREPIATADGGVYLFGEDTIWYCYQGKAIRVKEVTDLSVGPKIGPAGLKNGASWARSENERLANVQLQSDLADAEYSQDNKED